MKINTILTGLIVVSLLACTSENKINSADSVTQDLAVEHSGDQEVHSTGLSLNNGGKWHTDESTRRHAANLNVLVKEFQNTPKDAVESYHVFAGSMQEEISGLIKDCRMQGADHDALHLWLEPVMKDIKDLKEIGTAEEGKDVSMRLTDNVQKFNQYFENAH